MIADWSMLMVWGGAMAVAGITGGLIAGLLGVGGGIVIVPVLYHLMTAIGVDEGIRMHVAVGTSLSTIILTSLVSFRSHHRRGSVDLLLLREWGPAILAGVLCGTALARYANGEALTFVFAGVAMVVALRMLFGLHGVRMTNGFPNRPVKLGLGALVGVLSTLMGIGGGTLSVPILRAFGYEMRKAVGTAAAIGFIIAVPGTVGFVIVGMGVPNRPPLSLGYVNIFAAAMLVPLTTIMAPLGARLAHAIPQRALQLCFAVFLAATSLRMIVDLFG